MKRNLAMAAGGILLLLLFPYIVTLFMTGTFVREQVEQAESGKRIRVEDEFGVTEIDLEAYAVGAAASQIPGDYEEEAVKAQMIIVRTYLYKTMGDADVMDSQAFSCGYWDTADREEAWGEQFAEYQEKFSRAGQETAGQVLFYEGQLIDAMFHRASAGMTRAAGEEFPYLASTDSNQDVDMDGYVTIREFRPSELVSAIGALRGQSLTEEEAMNIQIVSRDEAGYVQTVMAGTEEYSGDETAAALGLPSPAFSVSRTETGLKFVDKGSGHGYGLSQWGANKLAAEGQDAAAILSYYYKNITIAFFE